MRCGRGWLVDRRYVHRTPAVYLPGQREGEVEGMESGEWGRFQSTFTSLDRPLVQLSTRPLGMPGEDKRGPPF